VHYLKQGRPKICDTLKKEVAKSQQFLKLENISPIITSDHETLSEFLNLFVSSTQEDLDKLSTAVILMEREEIKTYTHKIISSFRNVGAFSSVEILQSIEKEALKGAAREDISALLRELIHDYKIIKSEIAQRMPKIA
jgi:HPt (histidine-containing phosphotransfer) domain-containing protein